MKKIKKLWARIRALFGSTTPPASPPLRVPSSPFPKPGAPAWGARLTAKQMEAIRARAESAAGTLATTPVFSPAWYSTATRAAYESEVKPRHNALQAIGLDALVYGDLAAFGRLDVLISQLCKEPTWAAPWHGGDASEPGAGLELEGAELGQDLALALFICEAHLLPGTVRKAWEAIRERVIEPYQRKNLWAGSWDRGDNWTAVLHGAAGAIARLASWSPVGAAVCASFLEESQIRIAAFHGFERYFETAYAPDGYCLEGASYWALGFGAWMNFSEILRALEYEPREEKFSAAARAAGFGVTIAGARGTAPAFGDCIEGYRIPADLCDRASRRYGTAMPEWAMSERFASLTAGALWLRHDASLGGPLRKLPPSGLLYKGVARLRHVDHRNRAWEVTLQAVPWAGLAHDQIALGTYCLHVDGKVISGDPGYPKPFKGQFGIHRFDLDAHTALGHPVVRAELKRGDTWEALGHEEADLDSISLAVGATDISLEVSDLALGAKWSRKVTLNGSRLEVEDVVRTPGKGFRSPVRFVTAYTFPDRAGLAKEHMNGLREIAPPNGFKGGSRWFARDSVLTRDLDDAQLLRRREILPLS